jgi:hypothetical protein
MHFSTAPAVETRPAVHTADYTEPSAPLPWITAFTEDSAEFEDVAFAPTGLGVTDLGVTDLGVTDLGVTDLGGTELGVTDHVTSKAPEQLFEEVVEGDVAPEAVTSGSENSPGVDVWPLDDAGERMRALTSALDAHTSRNDVSNAPVAQFDDEDPHPLPMPMWNDNDFVDVMPVHAASLPADVVKPASPIAMSEFPHTPELFRAADETEGASAAAELAARTRFSGADATARALENLAARVRSGDLVIPGFSTELGDAAALAAALAALLAAGG